MTDAGGRSVRIGFVVLSHTRPEQVERLIGLLCRMFDDPPVVCHHDFGQVVLDTGCLPSCVTFVRPHVPTRWGHFSLVRATLTALRALYERPDHPDWFILLSGQDYPIKPARVILDHYRTATVDAEMELLPLSAGGPSAWLEREFARRYLWKSLWLGGVPCLPGSPSSRCVPLRAGALPLWPTPFSNGLRCYAGSMWFSGNRRVAERALGSEHASRLERHLRHTFAADECYFHCIVGNAPDLRVSGSNLRHVPWSEKGPAILRRSDLPELLASNAHFARKFDVQVDAGILDILDQRITQP